MESSRRRFSYRAGWRSTKRGTLLRSRSTRSSLSATATRTSSTSPKLERVATHVTVDVDVEPSTPATMGALIAALGARMQATTEDATIAANTLDFVVDERAVPEYASVIRAFGEKDDHFSAVLESVHALGKFASKDARDVLSFALGIKNESIHLASAQALEQHKTPEALAVLWGLRSDPDYGVRLSIVHALDAQSPPDASKRLREMSRDKNKIVADEAKRLAAKHPSL